MPTLTIPNSFSANTTAQSAQVNANFNAVATLLNSTLLANDNIQALGIATSNLAANCVTGAKLNSDVVDNSSLQYSSSQLSIKALGVGTSHLAASAVTTAKINDGAVTQAKRAALGQQVSSSSGSVSTTSTSYTDVTNLSVSITTTGRPVFIGLISDASGEVSFLGAQRATTTTSTTGNFALLRDSTEISNFQLLATGASTSNMTLTVSTSSLSTIDVPSAGTYTYKAQFKTAANNTAYVAYAKLVAYEL